MEFFPEELLVLQLAGKAPEHPRLEWLKKKSKQQCLKELRKLAGVDFGEDPLAWENWVRNRRARRENPNAGLLIERLRGRLPEGPGYDWLREMSPEDCLQDLRSLVGRDLGKDPEAWEDWWRKKLPRQWLDSAFWNHLISAEELLLRHLTGTLPARAELAPVRMLTPAECWKELRGRSGQDFGKDLDAWQRWWRKERPRRYLDNCELLEPYDWTPEKLLLCRLRGKTPPGEQFEWLREMTDAECLHELRAVTGIDLGPAPHAWAARWQTEQARREEAKKRESAIDPNALEALRRRLQAQGLLDGGGQP